MMMVMMMPCTFGGLYVAVLLVAMLALSLKFERCVPDAVLL